MTGTFDTGMFLYDNQFVVISREVAQRFTGLGDAVSGIQVRLADPWQAPEIGQPDRADAWATPTGPSTGRRRTPPCSARSSWRRWRWG